MARYERKLPSTGFWIFNCNPKIWNAIECLEQNENLLYTISAHNRNEINVGEYGVLRVGKGAAANGTRTKEPGIFAIFCVTGSPQFIADSDTRYVSETAFATTARWRVRVQVIAKFIQNPLMASSLPKSDSLKHIHHGIQTSTVPVKKAAFLRILRALDIDFATMGESLDILNGDTRGLARSSSGILQLEHDYSSRAPQVREAVSKQIERGTVGRKVKEKLGGRCQICSALNLNPIAFLNSRNIPYSEAHHVMPVFKLLRGSLSHLNIMVLCPNHHRQAHFGMFKVLENKQSFWRLNVGGLELVIAKTKI